MPLIAITLKCTDRNKVAWQNISQILREARINCSKLTPDNNGFKASMATVSDAKKLFMGETLDQLADIRCTHIKPSSLKTNRTIIMKNVDGFIMDYSEEDICANINELNGGRLKIENVFKFPSGKTLKFECLSAEMAADCLQTGLFVFRLLCIQPIN